MKRLFLDTEFNGFGGQLMSLALVPEVPSEGEFYRVVKWQGATDPWVGANVLPKLWLPPAERVEVGRALADYLTSIPEPVVVADWPTDFEHLLALLISGPGQMHATCDFSMKLMRLPGFNTADHSEVPHNALMDARALRNYVVGMPESK